MFNSARCKSRTKFLSYLEREYGLASCTASTVSCGWNGGHICHAIVQLLPVGSSIQVLQEWRPLFEPFEPPETWADFPDERCRLFYLLKKYEIPGVVFLSGDVHHADLNARPHICEDLVDKCGGIGKIF